MNADLERDLAAWERGELARDELVARHGAEAAVVTDAHDALIRAAVEPSVDVDDAWVAFSTRLDEPGPVIRLAGRRVRTAALAVAAALMLAGSAIAVVGPEVGDTSNPVTPSPVASSGGVAHTSVTDRQDMEATVPTTDRDGGDGEGAGVDDPRGPTGDPTPDAGIDDAQGDDPQDDDSQGSGDVGDGDDSQGDDPQDDDSQGSDDVSDGDDQGLDPSTDAVSGDPGQDDQN